MRVTFSQIRGFVTVASIGSFTKAADVLHLSQPALTTRIRQLEEALDLRLLNRAAIGLAKAFKEDKEYFMHNRFFLEQRYHLRQRCAETMGLGPVLFLKRRVQAAFAGGKN